MNLLCEKLIMRSNIYKLKFNKWFFKSIIVIVIGTIIIITIMEISKSKRIDKLNQINNSKIKVITSYEEKSKIIPLSKNE